MAESPTGKIMGYVMGISEARNNKSSDWHCRVSAISVSEEYRRLGVAGKLMQFLEDVSERKKCYFVDLFVRVSNVVAVEMYKKMGYVVYGTMPDYYYTEKSNEYKDYTKKSDEDKDCYTETQLKHWMSVWLSEWESKNSQQQQSTSYWKCLQVREIKRIEDGCYMRRALSWDVDKISKKQPTQEEIAELERGFTNEFKINFKECMPSEEFMQLYCCNTFNQEFIRH